MSLLPITPRLSIALDEIRIEAVRAQGAGGQNVNKTSNAAHLRFDIAASSLPEDCKQRLLAQDDRRLSGNGVIVIKAQEHRSLEQNREAALERLAAMIRSAATVPRARKATRPSRAAKRKRLEGKIQRGALKSLRRKPVD